MNGFKNIIIVLGIFSLQSFLLCVPERESEPVVEIPAEPGHSTLGIKLSQGQVASAATHSTEQVASNSSTYQKITGAFKRAFGSGVTVPDSQSPIVDHTSERQESLSVHSGSTGSFDAETADFVAALYDNGSVESKRGPNESIGDYVDRVSELDPSMQRIADSNLPLPEDVKTSPFNLTTIGLRVKQTFQKLRLNVTTYFAPDSHATIADLQNALAQTSLALGDISATMEYSTASLNRLKANLQKTVESLKGSITQASADIKEQAIQRHIESLQTFNAIENALGEHDQAKGTTLLKTFSDEVTNLREEMAAIEEEMNRVAPDLGKINAANKSKIDSMQAVLSLLQEDPTALELKMRAQQDSSGLWYFESFGSRSGNTKVRWYFDKSQIPSSKKVTTVTPSDFLSKDPSTGKIVNKFTSVYYPSDKSAIVFQPDGSFLIKQYGSKGDITEQYFVTADKTQQASIQLASTVVSSRVKRNESIAPVDSRSSFSSTNSFSSTGSFSSANSRARVASERSSRSSLGSLPSFSEEDATSIPSSEKEEAVSEYQNIKVKMAKENPFVSGQPLEDASGRLYFKLLGRNSTRLYVDPSSLPAKKTADGKYVFPRIGKLVVEPEGSLYEGLDLRDPDFSGLKFTSILYNGSEIPLEASQSGAA